MEDYQGLIFKTDPIEQFKDWFGEARAAEPNDPEAMSLATAGADGAPNVRMVLCKSFDTDGIRFFTNGESAKGVELAANPQAAVCFHWKSLHRQVRAQGTVAKLPAAIDDEYFHTRHRESQISAWASAQSRPLSTMMQLSMGVYKLHDQFVGQLIPRPEYWGGYVITPRAIEFWSERPHRLHERMLYTRDGNGWQQQRLYP